MDHHTLPGAGTWVLVTLPQPYASVESPARYTVADVRDRQLTLRPEERSAQPDPPPGVPCLVRSILPSGRQPSCEAVVVACGGSMLIVEVAAQPCLLPRYRRPCSVRIEVPDADLGVIEGVLEDLTASDVLVHLPVLLEPDHRVFVTVVLSDLQPLLALAVVRDVHRWDDDDLVARLEFTAMAPSHRARLAALLEWPVTEPTDVVVDLTGAGGGSAKRRDGVELTTPAG
jgi:hypothetical protein